MYNKFVLEVYSEEIPAIMQPAACKAFHRIFSDNFKQSNIKFEDLKIYITPCRIIIYTDKIHNHVEARNIEKKGPKVGAPDVAISAFAKSVGKNKEDLEVRHVKDIKYYFYIEIIPQIDVQDILPDVIVRSMSEYVWPKSMYWADYDITWVRPLRNLMCLFGDKVLEFNYGPLKSNNITFGHKFMAKEAIQVKNSDDYFQKLSNAKVIYDQDLRKNMILEQISEAEKKSGCKIDMDNKLLEEVNGLVEYPNVLVGDIDEKFMQVPSEILVSAMKHHQKYFTTLDEKGNFASKFLFVSNIIGSDNNIISGNERVLSARLADAAFFYNDDLKTSSEDRYEKLSLVTFHAKLGDMKQKSDRIISIAKYLNDSADLAKAAKLCKSDLVSGAVDEFPELQGIMGSYYAKAEGYSSDVISAIRDHYKPFGGNDDPATGLAAYLAISDKIDSLVGLYIAGERATGSKDPYALRRYALGIIRTILSNKFDINLVELVENVSEMHSAKESDIEEILDFLNDRLRNYYSEFYDIKIVRSVINGVNNIVDIDAKLLALKEFLSKKESEEILEIFRRSNNILQKNKDKILEINNKDFDEQEERFYNGITIVLNKYNSLLDSYKYLEALISVSDLSDVASEFFENTLVITEDEYVTARRLWLLQYILESIFDKFANFEEL